MITTVAQRDFIFQRLGYTPSIEQQKVHDCPARIRLVAGGERSGKSRSAAMDLVSRMFASKLLWLVARDYERTRPEFNYICEALDKLSIKYSATRQVDPGEITTEIGTRIITKSAKDPRVLAAEAPDGILGCEGSQLDYETYLRLVGRLAEKRGWLLLSGTFESSLGWYPELFQRGQAPNSDGLVSFSLPTWSNLSIFPGGRGDPEIKRLEAMQPPEWFQERFGGIPMPPAGRIMSEFANSIHVGIGQQYDFDPKGEVHLFIDPGYAEAYAVEVCQRRGDHLFVVDEIFERNLITSDVILVAKQRPWWNKRVGGVIDIAGFQHQAMPAPAQVWAAEGGVSLQANKVKIDDGIEVVKRFLLVNPITNSSMLHINAKCTGLISEMGGCPNPITGQTAVYTRNETTGKPIDKNNHAVKALAYGLVSMFGYAPGPATKTKINRI